MKSIFKAIAAAAILVSIASPALADSLACGTVASPATLSVTEGSKVVLTASPAGSGYSYLWTVGTAFTGVEGLTTNQVSFTVPTCGSPGTWTVSLVMGPTGAPDACKDSCYINVVCSALCACPSISQYNCIATPTTWQYVCPSAPDSLWFQWWVQADPAITPVQGTISTWGLKAVDDSKTFTPSSPSWSTNHFNMPTELEPIKNSWVTFVIRQDTTDDGIPDTVLHFCNPVQVTLYWDPTASLQSSVT